MEENIVSSKLSNLMAPTKLSNLYAMYIDKRKFSSLGTIMWDEFSMHGHYEINGLKNFIAAMQQLENYKSTMHQIMNVNGEWQEKHIKEKHTVLLVIYLTKTAKHINWTWA